jgi:DNA recombination protein RmuC
VTDLETNLIIAVLIAAICGALFAAGLVLLVRRGASPGPVPGEIEGRIAQLADAQLSAQMAAQARSEQRLQEQERALTKLLDERFGRVTDRLNLTLERNTKNQKTVLDGLTERLAKIDVAQKNLDDLSSQVVGLQDILANKQARGAFGEVQLNNLITEMLPPDNYEFQKTLSNGKRADCVLTLPNPPGDIAIDAKFPLESYRALHSAETEADLVQARRQFVTDVSKHIKDIEGRYIIPGETADTALMFLPSEAVYAELHANFGDVVEKSYRSRVFIVSPTTLWATLNTVRAVLRDVRMKEAAGVIQAEVMKMLDDVGRLSDRVENMQRHFGQAEEDMRQIGISAEKVTKRGTHIQKIQVSGADTDLLEGQTEPIEDDLDVTNLSEAIAHHRPIRSVSD